MGIGSELRGDDAAGLVVVSELEALFQNRPPRIPCRVFIGGAVPENVTGQLRGFSPSHILLIDAADLGFASGGAALVDPARTDGVTFSTHAMPMAVFMQYLAATLKAEVLLIGIQPRSLEYAADMDGDVRRGCADLAAILAQVLE